MTEEGHPMTALRIPLRKPSVEGQNGTNSQETPLAVKSASELNAVRTLGRSTANPANSSRLRVGTCASPRESSEAVGHRNRISNERAIQHGGSIRPTTSLEYGSEEPSFLEKIHRYLWPKTDSDNEAPSPPHEGVQDEKCHEISVTQWIIRRIRKMIVFNKNKVTESVAAESRDELKRLCGFSIVDGSIQITNFDRSGETVEGISFPHLREVREFILIHKVPGRLDPKLLFPKLYIVRGETLLSRYSIVVYNVSGLKALDFPSLRFIERGNVFANGIEWVPDRASCRSAESPPTTASEEDFYLDGVNKGLRKIYSCSRQEEISDCEARGSCCHPECLSGCASPMDPQSCYTCKNVILNSECKSRCPIGLYKFHRRCVPRDFCLRRGFLLVERPEERECSEGYLCPSGFKNTLIQLNGNDVSVCQPCSKDELCRKICPGVLVEDIDRATQLRGCEVIDGALTISVRTGGASTFDALKWSLSYLTEVTEYIHVFSTHITSLNFLKGIARIGGRKLFNGRYALVVEENPSLTSVFDMSRDDVAFDMIIQNGDALFQSNALLCPSKILSFVNQSCSYQRECSYQKECSYQGDVIRCSSRWDLLKMDRVENRRGLKKKITAIHNGFAGSCNVIPLHAWILPSFKRGVLLNIYHDQVETPFFWHLVSYIIFYKKMDEEEYEESEDISSSCFDEWLTLGKVVNESEAFEKKIIAIPNLDSNSRYKFLIRAFPLNANGTAIKAQSRILQAVTPAFNPPPPTNFGFSSPKPFALDLWWDFSPLDKIHHFIVDIESVLPLKWSKIPNFLSAKAQTHFEVFRRHQENQSDVFFNRRDPPNREKCLRLEGTLSNEKLLKNLSSCFCNSDNNNDFNENDRKSSCSDDNHAAYYDEAVLNSNNLFSDHPDLASRPVPVLHVIDSGEKITLNNSASFDNLSDSGLYRIRVRACLEPVRCSIFPVIRSDFIYSNFSLCKLCSLHSAYTTAVVKGVGFDGKESAALLEVENRTLESSEGVNVLWNPARSLKESVFAYFLEIRDESSKKVIRSMYVPSRPTMKQSLFLSDLYTGFFGVRISAVKLELTSNITDWLSFHYLDKKRKMEIFVTKILRVVIVAEICIAIVSYVIWRRCRTRQSFKDKYHLNMNEMSGLPTIPVEFKDELLLQRDRIEIERGGHLGRGHFGRVFQGTLNREGEEVKVAVKIPRRGTKSELLRLMNEADIMQEVSTNHVVRMLGIVKEDSMFMLVMEFMDNKDLKTFFKTLRKSRFVDDNRLVRMACEAADGMSYLNSHNVIHRDLAARNCLIGAHLNLKIADLGIARKSDLADSIFDQEALASMPIRWMSPESLRGNIFSSKTDVWSYGVLLWEMATLGKLPYEQMSGEQVITMVSQGVTLPIPSSAIPSLKVVMKRCWHPNPDQRPSFANIFNCLKQNLPDGEKESLANVSFCGSQAGVREDSFEMEDEVTNLSSGSFSTIRTIDFKSRKSILYENVADEEDEKEMPQFKLPSAECPLNPAFMFYCSKRANGGCLKVSGAEVEFSNGWISSAHLNSVQEESKCFVSSDQDGAAVNISEDSTTTASQLPDLPDCPFGGRGRKWSEDYLNGRDSSVTFLLPKKPFLKPFHYCQCPVDHPPMVPHSRCQ